MTEESNFRIVTRAVAVIALLFALVQLLSLPNDVVALVHYMHIARNRADATIRPAAATYFVRVNALWITVRLLSFGISLWVAIVHLRGTPGVRRFYGTDALPAHK